MVKTHLRAPTIKIEFMTTENKFDLTYDTDSVRNSKDFAKIGAGEITNAIISLATQNDMSSDSGTFSLTMIGTQPWEELLNANDLIKIRINPSTPAVQNDCIMVGLLTSVKKIGTYGENSTVYSIEGQSMAKALMQMDIGTLQEISALLNRGWMYSIADVEQGASGTSRGINFQGKTASDIVRSIIQYFLLDHAVYEFAKGTKSESSLKDYIAMDLTSHGDEYLTDQSDFVSYTGSLRQFISEAQAKPFNEFFQEYTKDGKCKFIMRPTPFEKKDWKKLPVIRVPSINAVEVTVSKSDDEAYSVFSCSIPSNAFGTNTTFSAQPKFDQSLIERYGYKFMEVENKYIFQTEAITDMAGGTSTSLDSTGFGSIDSADVETIRKASLAYTDKGDTYITAENIDKYIKKRSPSSPFIGKGSYFITAGRESGLNPIYIMAHACLESAWGKSDMSHNYFGIGAFDNNPQNGHKYGNSDMKSGLVNGAKWIADNFYKAGQKSLYTMRHNGGKHEYATDPEWDIKIAKIMAGFYSFVNYDFTTNSTTPSTRDNTPATEPQETETEAEKKKKEEQTEKAKKEKEEAEALNSTNKARLNAYSNYLFNWFADNPSFYSGSIRYVGNPDFRVGHVLQQLDSASETIWEYYIESVSHDFYYTTGYTTVVGVTRGLKATQDRFKHHNKGENFTGGFFGELALDDLYEQALADMAVDDSSSGSDSGDYAEENGNIYKADYDNNYVATVYVPSLGGINSQGDPTVTSTGVKFTDFQSVAVDPTVIPYGSIIAVKTDVAELNKLWLACDTGGAIKGKRLDLGVSKEFYNSGKFHKGKVGVAFMRLGSGAQSARDNYKNFDKIVKEINKKSLVVSEGGGSSGGKIISLARKYMKPNQKSVYVWGGGHSASSSPLIANYGKTIGVDCSGFTGWVCHEAKVSGWGVGDATNTANGQYNNSKLTLVHPYEGRGISKDRKLKILNRCRLGDFVFFNSNPNRKNSHIAIYSGTKGGTHYHIGSSGKAGTPSSGIKESPFDSYWLSAFNGGVKRATKFDS